MKVLRVPHRLPRSSFALVAAFALALAAPGCAAPAEETAAGEDEVSASSDRELARLGGGGTFALLGDDAVFVFDLGLFAVDAAGTKTRLADAPERAGQITVTERYVVVEASPLEGDALTFYAGDDGYRATRVPLPRGAIGLEPLPGDRVLVAAMEEGLRIVGPDGVEAQFAAGTTLRDLQPAGAPGRFHAVRTAPGERDRVLVEVDASAKTVRDVLPLEEGSYAYTFDATTKTFFGVRSHVSLPDFTRLEVRDADGALVKSVDVALTTNGGVASDDGAYYLAARSGRPPGGGSWKLLAYDKTTLEPRSLGRLEPSPWRLRVVGRDLVYSHSSGRTLPLRRRAL